MKILGQSFITTDDGTYGHHGFVTDILKEKIEKGLCDAIFACGPTPMLKGVAALGNAVDIPTEISLRAEDGVRDRRVPYVRGAG